MATSHDFLSRWSKRKLEESQNTHEDAEQSDVTNTEADANPSANRIAAEESPTAEVSETAANVDEQKPEEMSIANLLVSEASESVKKAALRKLFLSEEFNVRDGLDDYDDDYSNLKSLSEGVAETLRDWVKDKTEDDATIENNELAMVQTEASDADENEQEIVEPAQNESELDKYTVVDKNGTLESESLSEQVGQNIPHSK
ncbi:DUF3306 domain-containing protein [Vibrio natriegens]|uniref:DUF3306 domain-containing protein n=1 Tax=Vibrio TaxID=662 RepID=UPI002283CE2B|nr:DUF3306 domain-containing protein [Vibrio natriegens]MCY9878206.1 DUF3306 domain-containing protein [Vibrio natriegens]MEE3877938.1 DUF3306 domain-containing protein [Vibrio sp. YYF0003]